MRAFNRWGEGVDIGLWLDPPEKGLIDAPPKPRPRRTPRAPEVTRTQNSAKSQNGFFGISASRGVRKVILCDVFGWKKKLTSFNAQKNFRCLHHQSSQNLVNGPVIEPFPKQPPPPPPPVLGGSIDSPSPT